MSNEHRDDAPREKIGKLFRFLGELDRVRKPPPADIKDYEWSIHLDTLPAHAAIRSNHADTGEEASAIFELLVDRAEVSPCPAPPASLRAGLGVGWDDPLAALRVSATEGQPPDVADAEARDIDAWSNVRDGWAAREAPAATAAKCFRDLHQISTRLRREAESFDLVLGVGMLTSDGEKGRRIRHPILLQRVELEYDADRPQFRVTEASDAPRLYVSLLRQLHGVSGELLDACERQLSESPPSLTSPVDLAQTLRTLTHRLLPTTGRFVDKASDPMPGRIDVHPGHVLLLRRRVPGFDEAINRFLLALPNLTPLPEGLLRVVGVHPPEGATAQGAGAEREIFLTKPSNADQEGILHRLSSAGTVLVQGPPGTGKTHTIANLIGHFLAHGKSVLVTSHTTKALRVLRNQVVAELQPLCVSLLDSDQEGRRQLEEAVNGIVSRFNKDIPERLEATIEALATRRGEVRLTIQALSEQLEDACRRQYEPIVVDVSRQQPEVAARWICHERSMHGWINDPISPNTPLPVSVVDVEHLYALTSTLDARTVQSLSGALPNVDQLPHPDDVGRRIDVLAGLTSVGAQAGSSHVAPAIRLDSSAAGDLVLARLDEALGCLETFAPWLLQLCEAGLNGGPHIQAWEAFLHVADEARTTFETSLVTLRAHAPSVELDWPLQDQLAVAQELLAHVESGKTLGGFSILFQGRWKSFLKSARVISGPPFSAEHFRALVAHLALRQSRDSLRRRWAVEIEVVGGPSYAQLGNQPEQLLPTYVTQMRAALNWLQDEWMPVDREFATLGVNWTSFLQRQPPVGVDLPELSRLRAAASAMRGAIEIRLLNLRRREAEEWFENVQVPLNVIRPVDDTSGIVGHLRKALATRDPSEYREAWSKLALAQRIAGRIAARDAISSRLEVSAPKWAKAIRARTPPHDGAAPPSDPSLAWRYRQTTSALAELARSDPDAIQRALGDAKDSLKQIDCDLVAARSWLAQKRKMTHSHVQALTGWVDTVKKIGKGTGVRVPRLRAEARKLLERCREAVPVWVMPLGRVIDSYDLSRTQFDVVIIDEASQLDVLGIVALAIGKQVVVVGDSEQVSPPAVAQNLVLVQSLIDQHLVGIPNHHLYDGRTSLYDIARQAFGDRVRLREHFRCAREIIEFSNALCYEGEIVPLRDTSAVAQRPHLVPVRVAGERDGKVNLREAEEIASLLVAATTLPEYESCTFGVISMIGEEQAEAVDRLLEARMDFKERERRRVICGTPAQFQGDERDVVFISMVDAPPEQGLLPLQDRPEYRQRLNVAASRARNQLWVIHSVDPEMHLKAGDLRKRFLNYVRVPAESSVTRGTPDEPAESPFKRDVIRRLDALRCRVLTNFDIGTYRLGLVVEGPDGHRAAVECYGDRSGGAEHLKAELEKQNVLERLGWKFLRLRAWAFYLDPDTATDGVRKRLADLGIEPWPAGVDLASNERRESGSVERVQALAAELRAKWLEEEQANGEADVEPSAPADRAGGTAGLPQRNVDTPARGGSLASAIQSAFDSEWRGRSELMERSGIVDQRAWTPTINDLLGRAIVEKTGEKRTTRYRLRRSQGDENGDGVTPVSTPTKTEVESRKPFALTPIAKQWTEFILQRRGAIIGTARWTGSGIEVQPGSRASLATKDAATASHWRQVFEKLSASGVVHAFDTSSCEFVMPFEFSKPSSAATFVAGCPTNGWTEWTTRDGASLEQLGYRDSPVIARPGRKASEDLPAVVGTSGAPPPDSAVFITKARPTSIQDPRESEFTPAKSTPVEPTQLFLKRGGMVVGTARWTGAGIEVLPGEKASLVTAHGASVAQWRHVFEKLLTIGAIRKLSPTSCEFVSRYVFSAPSTAASFLLGRPTDGWIHWKTMDGRTLDELGHRPMQPPARDKYAKIQATVSTAPVSPTHASTPANTSSDASEKGPSLIHHVWLRRSGSLGMGLWTGTNLVVLPKSTASLHSNDAAFRKKWLRQRDELVEDGALRRIGQLAYEFTHEHPFDSPSGAATFLLGRESNGWIEWYTKDGRALMELRRAAT